MTEYNNRQNGDFVDKKQNRLIKMQKRSNRIKKDTKKDNPGVRGCPLYMSGNPDRIIGIKPVVQLKLKLYQQRFLRILRSS